MNFRAAGVAIPVFSLRSEAGCGVGEFLDLKPMAEWAASVGMKMLQILPINDTTSSHSWTDSYPYSAISVYALHPLYLRLDEMSYPLVDGDAFRENKESLNRGKQLDYEAVMKVKWQVTREVFDKHRKAIPKDKAFLGFLKRNRDWVLDYAVFSVKRDAYGTADFPKWEDWAQYDSAKVQALSNDPEVLYFVWLQYELDRQLSEAVLYLRSLGVALKGDLPIGVDRESVDAWAAPHLFKMETQTGAPPDGFAVKGQNWGFPTYDWEEMKKDGYAWWRSRFEKLSRYFDVYRIDHILGFFRIWQIPVEHVDGIMGWFDPALPVKLEEFEQRGIPFDRDRFCEPFINDELLEELFGELTVGVRQDFLQPLAPGVYRFKQRFSTQRAILDFFSELKPGDWANQEWLRDTLVGLVSEVLFFEVEGSQGTEFHPRMEMQKTRSFQALDEEVQTKLKQVHDDYFYSRQNGFWEGKAYEKLPAMRGASDMLLCGEDLGMVPDCVPGVMRELGMLELVIQRWPKTGGMDFYDLKTAPHMSVVSTGTHDMSTLRGWWREDEAVRANFAWEIFGMSFSEKELSGEMARRIVGMHMESPAMWAVFPLQDLLAMDENLRSNDIEGERINVPAITPFYWRWRIEMNIGDLREAADFNATIRDLVIAARRDSAG
jgi:4-alpha-glucanotransferase